MSWTERVVLVIAGMQGVVALAWSIASTTRHPPPRPPPDAEHDEDR